MAAPTVGLTEVDKLITRAIELGLTFPPGVTRWQLLAWAAESLDLKRSNATEFERGGFTLITRRHFPTTNP